MYLNKRTVVNNDKIIYLLTILISKELKFYLNRNVTRQTMNALNQIVIQLLIALQQKNTLNVVNRNTDASLHSLLLLVYQLFNKPFNLFKYIILGLSLFLRRISTIPTGNFPKNHTNYNPANTIFLIGKNKFIFFRLLWV